MPIATTADLDRLVRREHADPHALLGAHPHDGGVVLRAFRPAAAAITARPEGGEAVALEQVHPGGIIEGVIEGAELPLRYELEIDYGESGTFTLHDPYAFLPTLGEPDLHLAAQGRHAEPP